MGDKVLNWVLQILAGIKGDFFGSVEIIIEGGQIVRVKTTTMQKPPAVDNRTG